MRFLLRVLKWLVAALVLLVLVLLSPVAYVELACRGTPEAGTYTPLLAKEWQRREANTYLTYPEWHIVYAYDGLAETLKTGDEYQFDYLASIAGFWTSTCSLMQIADQHGGPDQDTRIMIHTIGASFTLEMGLKAAYEETLGRVFAMIRGPQKSPQDLEALKMAVDYAGFLRQTPWYKYDFDSANRALWAAPLIDPVRGWERRLALGTEWKAKTGYAGMIAAGVEATGAATLTIRSVITGISAAQLQAIGDVSVINEGAEGITIETPRYDLFTRILVDIAKAGGQIREIAGNDEIMVSITLPSGQAYSGAGTEIARISRQGFATERVLLNVRMAELGALLTAAAIADPGLEHVFDF